MIEYEPNKDEMTTVPAKNCFAVAEGDVITRLLAGVIPMELKVTKVSERLIHCGTPCGTDEWTFDRSTGVEVDEELGWGPNTWTGSYIKEWTTP